MRDGGAASTRMFRGVRMKITGVTVSFVLLVLIVVFVGMMISEYNAKMEYVSVQLTDAISSTVKGSTVSSEDAPTGGLVLAPLNQNRITQDYPMVGRHDSAFNLPDQQQSQGEVDADNLAVPNIGDAIANGTYVPIIIYRIDHEAHCLVAVNDKLAHLTEESLADANERLVDAPYGFERIQGSSVYYLKKRTAAGDMIAFTDIASVDAYVESMTRALSMIALIVLLGLGTAAWFASSWIVQPAEEAWESQRRFIADASHELKTPISVITANSSIVLDDPTTSEEAKKWTNSTLTEAYNMKSLVEDMLYLAANDAKKEVVFDDIDLSKEASRAVMQFEARAFEKGNTIEDSEIEKGVYIEGDVSGIRRMISILLDNACKYSHPNTIIQVALTTSKKECVLTVSDEGDPIPKEMEEEIFDRFVRTDESRHRVGGYGLGLAMAKDIVEIHDGEISARTGKDGRTVFEVVLPKAKGPKA